MQFEKGYLYHIYNQGNNHRKIFFNQDNYLFFLKKIKRYITPYVDILAWCLMPNHFHLMVYVKEVVKAKPSDTVTQSRIVLESSDTMTQSHGVTPPKLRNLNDSIGIMLRSYTRAINKQERFSGKLFREKTKAECINCHKGITPSYISQNGITQITYKEPENQYPQVCLNYIHQNPVKAKLVNKASDWDFSSAKDYCNLRKGKLVNKKVATAYVDIRILK
jgi:putative transposase